MQIKSGNDVVSGLRRRDQFLRRLLPVLVERKFVFTVLAGKHVVERLLESFASLGFGPDGFVIVDNAIRISSRFSGVTNNLTSNLSIRINPDVNRPDHHTGRQIIFDAFVLLWREILCDLKRHDSAVAVMTKDRLIGNPKPASD